MEALWKRLEKGAEKGTLSAADEALAEKLAKATQNLSRDPFYPGLQSHEIEPLSRRIGMKVFQSYLENQTPSAGRLFWVYGPNRKEISILGLEPHPNPSQRSAYGRVRLSDLPPAASAEKDPPKGKAAQKSARRKK